jgi:hypothetical protein
MDIDDKPDISAPLSPKGVVALIKRATKREVSTRSVLRWLAAGQIRGARVGGRWGTTRAAVEAFVRRGIPATEETES